ncbi:hypothetical protein Desdi_1906 [Desulfitobacterium dichloroeliminans LMG P-21439]|uniref:Uncharacterized protein n=1 Tax=Desulfitobacterium dichloroeliminans (strain LMG P-21439 / DCA1) TaxID=871963 RepID=L0F8J0_DESDL|nr:hypothetical protein [Desulfitobacterium dichloroeliminans]AGA69355.1 hypothetical protein Desdi_1906 [Desulfitobacterium dichloroeliminans LMG P-21439]
MQQVSKLSREKLSSLVILFCLIFTMVTSIGVNLLDVKVLNIELIDRELFSVITEKGNVNIHSDDILRIERSFSKESLTGKTLEQDKIYTNKGFIYLSSQAPYAMAGQKIINSVDYYGLLKWERTGVDLESINKLGYSIGTPPNHVPILFSLISLQYAALSIGGMALIILVFPFRLGEEEEQEISSTLAPQEHELVLEDSVEYSVK